MKARIAIWTTLFLLSFTISQVHAQTGKQSLQVDFYGSTLDLQANASFLPSFPDTLSITAVQSFCAKLEASDYTGVISEMKVYRDRFAPDDWLDYQLIRKTAQAISPKADNYWRYTIYKWFLLIKSGYSATLDVSDSKLLLYVQCDEDVFDVPSHTRKGKQYVCLNYHDYPEIDFTRENFTELIPASPYLAKAFSYKITRLPDFKDADYYEKELNFSVYNNEYRFKIKLSNQVQSVFTNYPVVDYSAYFNIPLSRETYASLIPLLRQSVKGQSVRNGVDFLMRFTRYSFLFETDTRNFGKEKRLTAEQTLFSDRSDCEDRAALFFYLVKEIYNIPMIVLSYPKHLTVAVKFEKPVGTPVIYKGEQYSVCEPTPQKKDLKLGQMLPGLSREEFEVVYAYRP